jgi:hypothetical protein
MLDWGFGLGRSARTGLRLPGYVRPAGSPAPWSAENRQRAATGAGAVLALLAAIALAVHRLRQRA